MMTRGGGVGIVWCEESQYIRGLQRAWLNGIYNKNWERVNSPIKSKLGGRLSIFFDGDREGLPLTNRLNPPKTGERRGGLATMAGGMLVEPRTENR